MYLNEPDPWPTDPEVARRLQTRLAAEVCREDRFGEIRLVAGLDIGFEAHGSITRAAAVVLAYPSLVLQDATLVRVPTRMPYIPGLLSFREAPAALAALDRLTVRPDLLLCDGQGIAHPRRFGLACHLGLIAELPAIGVAKSRLLGEHPPLPERKGAWVPLVDRGEQVGALLRTRQGVKPLYISIGHRVSLESALSFALGCVTRFRLPETTRWAHRLASGPFPLPAELAARCREIVYTCPD